LSPDLFLKFYLTHRGYSAARAAVTVLVWFFWMHPDSTCATDALLVNRLGVTAVLSIIGVQDGSRLMPGPLEAELDLKGNHGSPAFTGDLALPAIESEIPQTAILSYCIRSPS
jgi:hypothetical protein